MSVPVDNIDEAQELYEKYQEIKRVLDAMEGDWVDEYKVSLNILPNPHRGSGGEKILTQHVKDPSDESVLERQIRQGLVEMLETIEDELNELGFTFESGDETEAEDA